MWAVRAIRIYKKKKKKKRNKKIKNDVLDDWFQFELMKSKISVDAENGPN